MQPLSPRSKPIVSIFVHCFPPAKGGVEFLTGEIFKILQKQYSVHVFTGQGLTLDSYKTFSNYTEDGSRFIHRLSLNQALQRICNKFLHRFVVKFGIFSPFFFGPILNYSPTETAIIKKSKAILGLGMPTKSFYDAYTFAKKYHKPLISLPAYHNVPYYNHCPFFQQVFNYAQNIIYLTDFEKNELFKSYSFNPSKLSRLTFCPFTKKQINIQRNKNITKKFNSKNPVLGFVGQINPRKNLFIFKNFLDQGFRILFAGAKTASSPEIEKYFRKYLTNGQLKIIYDFPDADKEKIFRQIDLFINPSVEESLGIVNFEAIFYGLPLIISPESAFSSILGHHPGIKLVPPHSYRKIANKQYNKIFRQYNFDNYQQSLIDLFRQKS